ncbi:MAG: DUF1016 domain-containing protein [Candidatus Cloacimonetes bacterium]|nr:DUF1016 domain-containing protein [Candidatus Cloacimonadota bacterium]
MMKESIDLFSRIVSILEKAKSNVARSVNINMVIAYWLIGKEIVLNIQNGDKRAEYGKNVIENLSEQLNRKYGSGFSVANLKNFRTFYIAFQEREKSYPLGSESDLVKSYPASDELKIELKGHPTGGQFNYFFNPNLSWSHYRAIMRVRDKNAREFYEKEAAEGGWNKRELERQIHSSFYERIMNSNQREKLISETRNLVHRIKPEEVLTSPNVLEFLNIPDVPRLHETHLEEAIINNLHLFLLELGKGFSFVARQKKLQYEDKSFFVDLVFYNFYLKCFVLIDLKIGELTHQDIGQMDSYVRIYEDLYKLEDDNPTIGIILCSEKNEAVAKYSVLSDNKNLFASKYLLYLPTEKELEAELIKERKLIESRFNEKSI